MPDAGELRAQLVELLRERDAVRTIAVATAFAEVPRELFIPEIADEGGLEKVYRDEAHVTKKDSQGMAVSSSSQPAIMAAMLELLELEPGQRVLEIGAGTGYNAALLERLVGPSGQVTTIDVDPEIAARARWALFQAATAVEVVVGDGRQGHGSGAPYDRIIVTAAARALPTVWLEQLAEGGRLVVPVRLAPDADAFDLIPAFVRRGDSLRAIDSTWGGFMSLHGGEGMRDVPAATLSATFSSRGRHEALVSVTGAGVERLSVDGAKRLVAALLGRATRSRTGGAISLAPGELPGALIYLTTRVPQSRRIWIRHSGRHGVGLVGAGGRGIAALTMPNIWSLPHAAQRRWHLEGWGEDAALQELTELVESWRRLEREGRDQLVLTALPAGEMLRLRFSWTRRRTGARTPASA